MLLKVVLHLYSRGAPHTMTVGKHLAKISAIWCSNRSTIKAYTPILVHNDCKCFATKLPKTLKNTDRQKPNHIESNSDKRFTQLIAPIPTPATSVLQPKSFTPRKEQDPAGANILQNETAKQPKALLDVGKTTLENSTAKTAKHIQCEVDIQLAQLNVIPPHPSFATQSNRPSSQLDDQIRQHTLPNLTDFSSCRDYLNSVLSNRELNIKSNDWSFLLPQIIDTIPANPPKGTYLVNGTTKPTAAGKHKTDTVKERYCHTFALSVCEQVGNISAALALIHHMRETKEALTHIHSGFVFRTYSKYVRSNHVNDGALLADVIGQKDESGESFSDGIFALYDGAIKAATNSVEIQEIIKGALEPLCYTSNWMKAYKLWEDNFSRISNDHGKDGRDYVHLPEATKALCMATLKNGREDLFWLIINDPSFHAHHLYLRYGATGSEMNMDVFTYFLRHLAKFKVEQGRSEDAYKDLWKLFIYFRQHFVTVTDQFYLILEKELLAKLKRPDGRSIKITKSKHLNAKGDSTAACNTCHTAIKEPAMCKEDLEMLKDHVIRRLIIKQDVYQRSNPTEFKKFQTILSNNPDYNIVIDGLNVVGLNAFDVDRRTIKKRSSLLLLHVLEVLDKMGIKILLFHRPMLRSYPDLR